jgi:hypothetical protein
VRKFETGRLQIRIATFRPADSWFFPLTGIGLLAPVRRRASLGASADRIRLRLLTPPAKMAVAHLGCHFGSLREKLNCAPEASELRKLGAFPQFFPIAHCASWAISRETVAQVGEFLGKNACFCLRESTAILAKFAQVGKNSAKSGDFVAQVGRFCGDSTVSGDCLRRRIECSDISSEGLHR